jgi:hypothetical protein
VSTIDIIHPVDRIYKRNGKSPGELRNKSVLLRWGMVYWRVLYQIKGRRDAMKQIGWNRKQLKAFDG